MTTLLRINSNMSKLIGMLVLVVVLCAGLAGQAMAGNVTYYWQDDSSTNVGADGTANLPNNNNNNGHPWITTFSTTAPTGNTTQMRERYWSNSEVSAGYVRLGKVYMTSNYTQATTIGPTVTGNIEVYCDNNTSSVWLVLEDYDPNGAAGNAVAITSVTLSTNGQYNSNQPFTINGSSYTVPAGHRLVLDVFYNPISTDDRIRILFNNNSNRNPDNSWIIVNESLVSVSHTITASAGTGGTITPPGTSTVVDGTSPIYAIAVTNGYAIADVLVDNVSVGAVNSYTFLNNTADHSISATFVRQYTITSSAGTGGSISPILPQIVNTGGSAIYTITASTGYFIQDVIVNGNSVGAVTSYTISGISQDTTIAATFSLSTSQINNYCSIPPFIPGVVPPNVMIMLSIESPMQGAAYPQLSIRCPDPTDPNNTAKDMSPCTPAMTNYTQASAASNVNGRYVSDNYNNSNSYTGYFDPAKCYTYSGTGSSGMFVPSATTSNHTCSSAWSGNFLNFATTMALDGFRIAFTGGNRDTDVGGSSPSTVLLGGRQALSIGNSWYPLKKTTSASSYMPFSGTRYVVRHANGFSICSDPGCSIAESGAGLTRFPVTAGTTNVSGAYNLRVKVCDPANASGVESFCNPANNKPEGILQQYAGSMRFGLMSYAMINNEDKNRDGGVLRSNVKWIQPTILYGMKYNGADAGAIGKVITCNTVAGCANPEKELNTDGTFVSNPDGATSLNSGVINYMNLFGYNNGYKNDDPISEIYYQVVRYFKNLTPSTSNYCDGISNSDDGFVANCSSTKPNSVNGNASRVYGWRDPYIYPCSQSAVIGIQDANPWLDKRIPGTAFTQAYGSSYGGVTDYCDSSHPCDTDMPDLSNTGVPVGSTKTGLQYWTDKVGDSEGITPGTIIAGCVFNGTTACPNWNNNSLSVTQLSRVVGTAPGPSKENSYYISGLAYYAHMTDLRPDLTTTYKTSPHTLTSYFIDTQEPNNPMLVGKFNMLYLGAKYGGFKYTSPSGSVAFTTTNMPVPFTNSTCGTASPASGCAQWDNNGDGLPDNYFFASSPSDVSTALDKSFTDILKRLASGTAASILNNSQGSGANILQALFYPDKVFPSGSEAKWIGELHNLWYYLEPHLQATSVREDTVADNLLNIKQDNIVNFRFDPIAAKTVVDRYADTLGTGVANPTAAIGLSVTPEEISSLWKAGRKLWERNLTSDPRFIYTHMDNNAFDDSTTKLARFKSGLATALEGNATIQSYIQAANSTEATSIIDYVNGTDQGAYRSRMVQLIGTTAIPCPSDAQGCTREWKLGDIISSTPKIISNNRLGNYDLAPPVGYNDTSYASFVKTSPYPTRGMVFVGGNDGMLHAFQLGVLKEINDRAIPAKKAMITTDGTIQATAANSNLGHEEWAFIPKQTLPYLKYLADPNYNHLFYVDKSPSLVDASIFQPSTSTTDYSDYPKDPAGTTWRSILIGGMGFGGAAKTTSDTCTSPTNCVKTPTAGLGYSGFFALDVTNPTTPKYMWEFYGNNNGSTTDTDHIGQLGYSLSGPAIVRVTTRVKDISGNDTTTPDHRKNGKWFAVFVSGSTGPIDTGKHEFKGQSDQNLKVFIVDLATGKLLRTIDSNIPNAFGATISVSSAVDTDGKDSTANGFYSDDAIYIGYVKQDTTALTWTKGGVLRLLTQENKDPATWTLSSIIDNTGPVTTSIARIQDRNNKNLWLYFGTGRYYFKQDDPSTTVSQKLYAIKEPCYSTVDRNSRTPYSNLTGPTNKLDATCTDSVSGTLADALTTTISSTAPGWQINLDLADTDFLSERVITDPVAVSSGAIFFTTFKPSANLCTYGGNTLIWAMRYDTGGAPPAAAMQGKALIQVSTGAFNDITMSTAFTVNGGRRIGTPITGVPPIGQGLLLITNPKATKKILQIMEK